MDFENQMVTWYEVTTDKYLSLKMKKITDLDYDECIKEHLSNCVNNVIYLYHQHARYPYKAICLSKPDPEEIADIKHTFYASDNTYIGKQVYKYVYNINEGRIHKTIFTIIEGRTNGRVRLKNNATRCTTPMIDVNDIDGEVHASREGARICSFYEQDDYARYALADRFSGYIEDLLERRKLYVDRIKGLDNEIDEINNRINNIFKKGE